MSQFGKFHCPKIHLIDAEDSPAHGLFPDRNHLRNRGYTGPSRGWLIELCGPRAGRTGSNKEIRRESVGTPKFHEKSVHSSPLWTYA